MFRCHIVKPFRENGQKPEKNIKKIWPIFDNEFLIRALGGREPGGRLKKKDGLTRYGNSHVKDKTS